MDDHSIPELRSKRDRIPALRTQGDSAGARTLAEEVLEDSKLLLGEEDPETLGSLGDLVELLLALDDLSGA